MTFLWIFNCCKAQQEDNDAEQPWCFAREFENMVWFGFDPEWESVQERKQKLKQYNVDELRRQLELFGVAISKEKGQKSERKMKKEYRKLIMRQVELLETERARKSPCTQVRETRKPEQKMDLVAKKENGLGQGSGNTQDNKQKLERPREQTSEQQSQRREAHATSIKHIKEEEMQEKEKEMENGEHTEEKGEDQEKEGMRDDEVEKVKEKDLDAREITEQEKEWKQEQDLTKRHGQPEEEMETFNKIRKEEEGKWKKTVTYAYMVKVEEKENKRENTEDVASGTMLTLSLGEY